MRSRIANNIDWIFVSNKVSVPRWRTIAYFDGSRLTGTIPSDHFMVTAKAYLP